MSDLESNVENPSRDYLHLEFNPANQTWNDLSGKDFSIESLDQAKILNEMDFLCKQISLIEQGEFITYKDFYYKRLEVLKNLVFPEIVQMENVFKKYQSYTPSDIPKMLIELPHFIFSDENILKSIPPFVSANLINGIIKSVHSLSPCIGENITEIYYNLYNLANMMPDISTKINDLNSLKWKVWDTFNRRLIGLSDVYGTLSHKIVYQGFVHQIFLILQDSQELDKIADFQWSSLQTELEKVNLLQMVPSAYESEMLYAVKSIEPELKKLSEGNGQIAQV